MFDFGVARATESETGASMQTEAGQIIGTLTYMSPEQVAGGVGGADPRSDVYSLGVILYELLTGRLPHKVETSSIAEAARTIQHDAPTRPSAVVALVAGLAVSLVLYVQAVNAKDAADKSNAAAGKARDRAEGINTFLVEDLLKLAAEDDDARSMKLYDAVKRAAGNIDKRFEGHPETGSSMRSLVGTMMDRFGDYEAAIALHRKASEELAAQLGPDAIETLDARYNLAMAMLGNADQAGAEVVLRDLVEQRAKRYGADDYRTHETRSMLGEAIQAQGRFDEAEKLLREAVPALRDAGPAAAPDLCNALGNLGSLLRNKRQYDEAEKVLTEAVAVANTLNRPLSPAMIITNYGLAAVYAATKRHAEAEKTIAELLPSARRAFGDESYEVAMMLNLRGKCAYSSGDLVHAEEYMVGAFQMADKVLGRKRYETELLHSPLLTLYRKTGDDAKLEAVLKRAIELRENIQAEPRHGSVLGIKEEYASFLLAHNWSEEARAVMEPVLPIAVQYLPTDDPIRARVLATAARCGLPVTSDPPKEVVRGEFGE